MNQWFKKNWPSILALVLFIAICFIYFSPLLQGKRLLQSDVIQASAVQQEIMGFRKDGVGPLWTNAMFGGMPSFQIWAQYPCNLASHIIDIWNKVFPNPVNFVLLYLVGGFFLFRMLRFKPWLSFLGAIAIAFSSYNFVLVEAGHTGKALAIAFFAPILGAILMAFRGRRLWGAALLSLFLALEIRSNHLQMTYYLMIAILVLIIAELVDAVKQKKLVDFTKTAAALLVAAIIGLGVNFGTLWVTYEYAQETIRGKSDLVKPQATAKESKGLDKEYAYQWSEGVMESVTFLIPDAYGGANGIPFTPKSKVYGELVKNNVPAQDAAQIAAQIGGAARYWGDKPFTSGPYYFGAAVIFLFVLGLSLVKGPLKWGIAIATLLSVMLSWGRNFQWFSDIFFDYFPMYNKFRAVESILVIAGLLVPVLAVVLLNQIFEGKISKDKVLKNLKYTTYGLGGFLVVFLAMPGLFLSVQSPNDTNLLQQLTGMGGESMANNLMAAVKADRLNIARLDAFRSLVFVLLAAGLIWAYVTDKIKTEFVALGLVLTIIVDMWGIDKRYLKDDNFAEKRMFAQTIQPREVDLEIKQDTDPYYRVYDMTTGNAFANGATSKFHKSIGGYHAAKLMRYQNFIDSQLVKGNPWAFNMLNTKYIIMPDSAKGARVVRNEQALGNAWFVNGVKFVNNGNEELAALDFANPKTTAVINEQYKKNIDIIKMNFDTTATIKLVSYHPEKLVYESNSAVSQLVVFSEVYYDKGWNAYVDGKPHTYFRADYLLRAMQIDAGKHTIEFKFEPKSYYAGEKVSLVCSILLVAGIAGVGFIEFKKRKKTEASEEVNV
ncbi:YfhO family protein [Solitalea sp. MAHUQ-68]|uniref:YfhO family protein n=1 Tax=Solitalea agri TaxID=2953739 RepID=A0A9X2F1I3_9SPHI|nr:YfhO family protein [Solitalea agri]MCO4292932.1 YfhO family protein [Solitalea agri]